MDKNKLKFIFGIIFFLFTLFLIIEDKKKLQIIKSSLEPTHIKLYLLATILFYLFINYGINNSKINLINIDKKEYLRIKKIANQSLFGLVIAIFAHIHLFISPFWLIFFLMYFDILEPIS